MDKKVSTDDTLIAELAKSEGWKVLQDYLNIWMTGATTSLRRTDFDNLSQVSRLQGEIEALQKVESFVNRRRK